MIRKLQFKFVDESSEDDRRRVRDSLHERGAIRVRKLFPGDSDPELAGICIVEYRNARMGRRLLEYLRRSKVVEFAEGEVSRKLIN